MKIDHSAVLESHPLQPPKQAAERVVESIFKSKRIIVVTGAGISVSGGIPDFRSFDGLYNVVKNKYPGTVVKGKEIFDASLFKNEETVKIFYTFMSELKLLVDRAEITKAHKFIKRLNDCNKLLRCYTQNIDCLEERMGLSSEPHSSKSKVVMLHGSLSHVICTLCKNRTEFSEKHIEMFSTGVPPNCDQCTLKSELRLAQNKRKLPVGFIRPDIILYNEQHSSGDWVAELLGKDLSKRPDMLIVMGTSLKVAGIKKLVRDISKQIHLTQPEDRMSTLLINKSDVGISEWKGVFDARWIGSADHIVEFIESGLNIRERARKGKIPKSPTVGGSQRLLTEKFLVVKSTNAVTIKSTPSSESLKENGSKQKTEGEKKKALELDFLHLEKVKKVVPPSPSLESSRKPKDKQKKPKKIDVV